jgi:hypothetical protein
LASSGEDDLFAGRGSPAFMSLKEPAIRLLRETYSESFALTQTKKKGQTHLFLIRFGLWALCYTFTRKNYRGESTSFGIPETLETIESALSGRDPELRAKLDSAIEGAKERIQSTASKYRL